MDGRIFVIDGWIDRGVRFNKDDYGKLVGWLVHGWDMSH